MSFISDTAYCNKCNKPFSYFGQMVEREMNDNSPFKCPTCGRGFTVEWSTSTFTDQNGNDCYVPSFSYEIWLDEKE